MPSSEMVVNVLRDAFDFSTATREEPPISHFVEMVENIYLMSQKDKDELLPHAMASVIWNSGCLEANEVTDVLIDYLDADFSDPDDLDSYLKKARMQVFSSFNSAQASAIVSWLEWVRSMRPEMASNESLQSALRYWERKARVST